MGSGVRVRVELLGDPVSVRQARRLVTDTLREWELTHLDESATLLVSEVVTNAVLHARTDLVLELRLDDTVLRVLVTDGAQREPERRRHGLQAGTGRGLGLLQALSSRWGSEPASDPWRKTVWFELPVDPALLPSPRDGALEL